MAPSLETWKGQTTIAGEPDITELMEFDLQTSNTSFYMRILLFFLFIAFCLVCLCSRRAEAQCSRNGGRICPYSQAQRPLSLFEVSL